MESDELKSPVAFRLFFKQRIMIISGKNDGSSTTINYYKFHYTHNCENSHSTKNVLLSYQNRFISVSTML